MLLAQLGVGCWKYPLEQFGFQNYIDRIKSVFAQWVPSDQVLVRSVNTVQIRIGPEMIFAGWMAVHGWPSFDSSVCQGPAPAAAAACGLSPFLTWGEAAEGLFGRVAVWNGLCRGGERPSARRARGPAGGRIRSVSYQPWKPWLWSCCKPFGRPTGWIAPLYRGVEHWSFLAAWYFSEVAGLDAAAPEREPGGPPDSGSDRYRPEAMQAPPYGLGAVQQTLPAQLAQARLAEALWPLVCHGGSELSGGFRRALPEWLLHAHQ